MLHLLLCISIMQSSILVLFDSNQINPSKNWKTVNDGVMGGKSEGDFELTEENLIHFKGSISLRNNGGFSSLRYLLNTSDVSKYKKIRLTILGDGKQYQFRIKNKENPNFSYITYFDAKQEVIELELLEMYPSFRGRKLNLENFSGGTLTEIGFLFGNKKEESFSLKIQKIELLE